MRSSSTLRSSDETTVERFVRIFQREPNAVELDRFRRIEADLRLRIPRRARRRAASVLARL